MLIDRVTYVASMLQIYGFMILLVILFPAFMWRSYFKRKKRSVSFIFLFCILTQECFLTNLVLLLGFFNIANQYTLLLGMAIEYGIVRWKTHYLPNTVIPGKERYRLSRPVTVRGLKAYARHRLLDLKIRMGKYRDWEVWTWIRKRWFVALALTAVIVYNCLFLNHNMLNEGHCYQFSDCPVHTNWVYMLKHGVLFSAGIYPFYMHAMLYAVNVLSGAHLREVVLFFGSGQTLLLIGCMFIVGRKLFKNDMIAFIPLVLFSVLMSNGRYAGTLPQECGMFACMALAYFMLNYLQSERPEHHVEKDGKIRRFFRLDAFWFKRYMNMDLMMIMICVACVIGFHFYTAIAAIILVFAFAVAYLPRLFGKRYWLPLLTAGLLGAMIAVTPFVACLARGIPFQESMAWAMSLINGETWVNEQQSSYSSLLNGEEEPEETPADQPETVPQTNDPGDKPELSLKAAYLAMTDTILYAVPPGGKMTTVYVMWGCLGASALIGAVFYLFKKSRWTGAGYITFVIYCIIMLLLGSMALLGLPMFVERQRIPVFLQPFTFMLFAIPFDAAARIFTGIWKKDRAQLITKIAAVAVCAGIVAVCITTGNVHHYFDLNRTYYNEAEYLLRNIRSTFPAKSFIVVSPTDDYYGVVDEGFHTELSEMMGMIEGGRKEFTLPTEYNFIFVEKKLLQDINYGSTYISPEFAKERFVFTGLTQDYYYQRAALESKAYYWAQAMKAAYPDAFTTYFENDIFVVYLLHQNPYYPYDLRLDFSEYVEADLAKPVAGEEMSAS